MGGLSQKAAGERLFKKQDMRINPLLGGAEAEGFRVGCGHEEPTPALRDRCRCAPPLRGGDSQAGIKLLCKIQVPGSSMVRATVFPDTFAPSPF